MWEVFLLLRLKLTLGWQSTWHRLHSVPIVSQPFSTFLKFSWILGTLKTPYVSLSLLFCSTFFNNYNDYDISYNGDEEWFVFPCDWTVIFHVITYYQIKRQTVLYLPHHVLFFCETFLRWTVRKERMRLQCCALKTGEHRCVITRQSNHFVPITNAASTVCY